MLGNRSPSRWPQHRNVVSLRASQQAVPATSPAFSWTRGLTAQTFVTGTEVSGLLTQNFWRLVQTSLAGKAQRILYWGGNLELGSHVEEKNL